MCQLPLQLKLFLGHFPYDLISRFALFRVRFDFPGQTSELFCCQQLSTLRPYCQHGVIVRIGQRLKYLSVALFLETNENGVIWFLRLKAQIWEFLGFLNHF
jgi:hypothetical protein